MGLDITHRKSTLKKPEKLTPSHTNYILESEFEGFDVGLDYFHNCIQNIDAPEILETIIFPKKENEIEEIKKFLSHVKHFLFEKDKENIEKSLQNFISKNQLSGNLLHSWETSEWTGFYIFRMKKQTGFYFEEIGEQRKGMNNLFWTRFSSDDIHNFTKKEDFEHAFKCVDFYWDSDTQDDVEQRIKMFKENFVDKYEPNKSWLSLSY
ncbi:hypothetical protein CLU81_3784 [Flavobacterium sp. 9]|uniref:hypothetical protein n=1 Tax=Flavobacterium sp. 9 TaxID=2035198 RepID=UPI000C18C109|nr:hypothetical protein [Flavobacterium sp. 9]PIF33204.1 hypothetical protein CLU81_3784 [Flavobacterium sp. 9]